MLVVNAHLGRVFPIIDGMKECDIRIGEYVTKMDLVVLEMEDYDVILGMD